MLGQVIVRSLRVVTGCWLVMTCACSEITNCRAIIAAAVGVRVRDASTGANVASNAILIWSASYAPSVQDTVRGPLTQAADSAEILVIAGPGTYALTVQRSGYQTWSKQNVVVGNAGSTACPVSRTVYVVADLVKLVGG